MNERRLTDLQITRMLEEMRDLIFTSNQVCAEPTWSYDEYGYIVIKSMAPYQTKLLARMGYSFGISENGTTLYKFNDEEDE